MAATFTMPRAPRRDAIRRRLDRWRATRPHRRARIPEPIWAAAVGLARQDGLSETARALGLSYTTLKQRLEAHGATPTGSVPTFVELAPAPTLGACVIEVPGPDGHALRIHLQGLPMADLLALSRAVWSGA